MLWEDIPQVGQYATTLPGPRCRRAAVTRLFTEQPLNTIWSNCLLPRLFKQALISNSTSSHRATELGPEEAAPCLKPDVAISSLISNPARSVTQPQVSSCTSQPHAAKQKGMKVLPAHTGTAAGCFHQYQFSAKLVRKNKKALLSKKCLQPICHYEEECLAILTLPLKLRTKEEDTTVSTSAERGLSRAHELDAGNGAEPARGWADGLGIWLTDCRQGPKLVSFIHTSAFKLLILITQII